MEQPAAADLYNRGRGRGGNVGRESDSQGTVRGIKNQQFDVRGFSLKETLEVGAGERKDFFQGCKGGGTPKESDRRQSNTGTLGRILKSIMTALFAGKRGMQELVRGGTGLVGGPLKSLGKSATKVKRKRPAGGPVGGEEAAQLQD